MTTLSLAERRKAGTLKLGYCVPAFAMPSAGLFRVPNLARIQDMDVLANAKEAERLGFDSLWDVLRGASVDWALPMMVGGGEGRGFAMQLLLGPCRKPVNPTRAQRWGAHCFMYGGVPEDNNKGKTRECRPEELETG